MIDRRPAALVVLVLWMPAAVRGQAALSTGSVVVTITAQKGSVRLPGVSVETSDSHGRVVASAVSDEEGTCRIADLAPGQYEVHASLQGFDDGRVTVAVEAGGVAAARLDLGIAGLSDHVEVVAREDVDRPSVAEPLGNKSVVSGRTVDELPIAGNTILGALKLFAGVVDGPAGTSVEGARTSQTAFQIGMAAQTDSSTGNPLFLLPADAVDSVEFLSNPYAVEFGRFSSGLTVINTRRAGDTWRLLLNTPDFSLRPVRDKPWALKGIGTIGPRIGIGGPLVKGRLFVEESAQVRYQVNEVMSRPQDETQTTKSVSSFTRIDAVLSPRQSIVGSVNVFSSRAGDATLNTFNGPDVAADVNQTLVAGNVAARSTLSDALVAESTIQTTRYDADVGGHGTSAMILEPSANSGSFFNRQSRATTTVQWVEAATGSQEWGGLSHLFRFGFDVMHSAFDGTSSSSPVEVRSDDGTLVRRLVFSGPTVQSVTSTDVAVFAQDRIQAASRLLLEFGGRGSRRRSGPNERDAAGRCGLVVE